MVYSSYFVPKAGSDLPNFYCAYLMTQAGSDLDSLLSDFFDWKRSQIGEETCIFFQK